MTRGSAFILFILASCALSGRASADACASGSAHCLTKDVSYPWSSPSGLNVMLDTGWVPEGSPLSVRIYLAATGYAAVTLAGDAGISWPSPITVGFSPDTGQLTVDYGFELTLQFRFHVTVLGQDIDWEGNIPIPGLPSDLRMFATKSFDSFLLPGAMGRPASVADATADIRVLDANVLGSIIPIPGLSGGIALDARASLDAQYRTDRISIGPGIPLVLSEEDGSVVRRPRNGTDYGPSIDLATKPSGTLDQAFNIVLTPTIYLDIFGFGFSVPVFSIPIKVLDTSTVTSFPQKNLHFALADVAEITDVDFGSVELGSTATSSIGISNEGEADLVVTIEALPPGVTADAPSITLGSGLTDVIALDFVGETIGMMDDEIVLSTNDPDMPEIRVPVTARVFTHGELPSDGGVDGAVDDGGYVDGGVPDPMLGSGCGCRADGGGDNASGRMLVLVAAIGLGIVRRRAGRRGARSGNAAIDSSSN